MTFKSILIASGLFSTFIAATFASAAPEEATGSLHETPQTSALHAFTPSWLDLKVENRTRYETFSHSFKKGQAGSNQQIHQRTRLEFGVREILHPFELYFELADFRTPVSDRGQGNSPLFVDQWDIFQLHGDFVTSNLLKTGQPSRLEVGRLVMDFGMGRLVAGYRFGSFAPSFDGIQWWYGEPESWQIRAFATRPVQRHSVSPDSSTPVTFFWGGNILTHRVKPLSIESYYFGLDERGKLLKRRLTTFGLRLFKKPALGLWDFEIETTYQFGARLGVAFFGHRHHGEAGFTMDLPWRSRIVYLFDYSSGDRNPNKNFDFLFAKRRAEYGPTGILGIIFPSNILSPAGFRMTMHPTPAVRVMVLNRAFWLADAQGIFVGSGLQDSTGRANRYLGDLLDLAVTWKLSIPFLRNVILDAGFTHFFKGKYFDEVPNSPGTSDIEYVYSMATIRL